MYNLNAICERANLAGDLNNSSHVQDAGVDPKQSYNVLIGPSNLKNRSQSDNPRINQKMIKCVPIKMCNAFKRMMHMNIAIHTRVAQMQENNSMGGYSHAHY